MRFAKPLDLEALKAAAQASPRLLTLEEHTLVGGFGAAVLEAVAASGLRLLVRCHGIPDRFVEHAPQALQRQTLGLDVAGVVKAVREHFPELAQAMKRPGPLRTAPEQEEVAW